MQTFRSVGEFLRKSSVLVRATGWATLLGMLETVGSERGRRVLAVVAIVGCSGGRHRDEADPLDCRGRGRSPHEPADRRRLDPARGLGHGRAGGPRPSPLAAAGSNLPTPAQRARGRRRAVPDGGGAVHRRRRRGPVRARPGARGVGVRGASGRRGARARRADRRRCPAPDLREEHRTRDVLDEASRHPEADRGRAAARAPPGRHHRARGLPRKRRPAARSTARASNPCSPRSSRRRRCASRSS